MAKHHVGTYLNDHLAGSVVALELLEYLEGQSSETALRHFVAGLRADIVEDRRELEGLMGRLGVMRSGPRQAMAWLGEKATELKLRLDDLAGGELRVLEALEAVALGIDGKRALWRSLAAAAANEPALRGPDYARLERRAEEQRGRIEAVRLEAARAALAA